MAKVIAVFLVITFFKDIVFIKSLFALTSGPSQPEVQSFEPVGTNQMVDLFSGDFVYNIPLFDLPGPNGGYPFNLSYHSDIGMDQEASWVGLGWTLNAGAIIRGVRGLPDDFNGTNVKRTVDMKTNETWGGSFGLNAEIFGGDTYEGIYTSNGSAGLDIKMYNNSYKGFGYGVGVGVNYQTENSTTGLGLDLDMDSQNGAGINAQLSLAKDESNKSYSLDLGINSRSGLEVSLGMSAHTEKFEGNHRRNMYSHKYQGMSGNGGSSSISFSGNSFVPSIPFETKGVDLMGSFKQGIGLFGVYGNYKVSFFYNTQNIKENEFEMPSFGYLHLDVPFTSSLNNDEQKYMLDFSREKDGLVTKNSPNLAIPSLSYDYYSVTGQGIAGMYRPYRSDIGHVHDPFTKSVSNGGSAGGDIGYNLQHWGIGATYSRSVNEVKDWKEDNSLHPIYTFQGSNVTDVSGNQATKLEYEPVYFKNHGEYTSFETNEMDYIGKEEPVRFEVNKKGELNELILKGNTINQPITENSRINRDRMARNMNIQSFTEYELANSDVDEFKIKYLESNGSVENLTRENSSLIGGMSVLNENGMRYVYGIPAYNKTQREYLFSVNRDFNGNTIYENNEHCSPLVNIPDGDLYADKLYQVGNTEQYFDMTQTPKYAHSFLLTSILGGDYVDYDDIPGPSDGDLGYWVKFTYKKTDSDFKWRAPFGNANYIPGYRNFESDDKGSFVYGEKEVWYMATVETKTHIAVFNISPRHDGHGAKETSSSNALASYLDPNSVSFKLDEISIYLKKEYLDSPDEASPLKKVHFIYSYDLCQGVPNNDGLTEEEYNVLDNKGGKLTLEKVFFTYENNQRGSLSPYVFDYDGDQTGVNYNPGYSLNRYDRWGAYKPMGIDECENRVNTYTPQFIEGHLQTFTEKKDFKKQLDISASAWHLHKIQLPSGGEISVSYEKDDYSYVQHRKATQMQKIGGFKEWMNNIIFDSEWSSPSDGKIYFQLENPIPLTEANDADFFEKYIKPLKYENDYQLYFNINVKLRDLYYERINGYAVLDVDPANYGYDNANESVQDIDIDGDNITEQCITRGFITVKPVKRKGKDYHPFAAAAWQFIRTTKPELLVAPGTIEEDPATTSLEKANKVKSYGSIFASVWSIFRSYSPHAFEKRWGDRISPINDLDGSNDSWIRLPSSDKVKYGGGTRVKQIVLNDNWSKSTGDVEESSKYGQVYDYTTTEQVGIDNLNNPVFKKISSGVATYEPNIGGDENPLRYAKMYPQSIPFRTPNDLFFEYPINESYYPGPSIGYGKVTVKSLATYKAGLTSTDEDYEAGYMNIKSTTGISVNEFYTCKDFPVISNETRIDSDPKNLPIPIPFVGMIETNNLTASQGYVLKLNDMHGKVKEINNYSTDDNGEIVKRVNGVKYIYNVKPYLVSYDNTNVMELDNNVKVLVKDDGQSNPVTKTKTVGVEYEFFTDMRESKSVSTMGGLNFNTDLMFFSIPIPFPWPCINRSKKSLKTAVTNKIIHKAGILMKVIAYDGQSEIITDNLIFDDQTGRPLLTSVNNNFDDLIYSYNIPAYKHYDGMGPAYKNIGVKYSLNTVEMIDVDKGYYLVEPQADIDLLPLVPGDEVISNNGKKATLLSIVSEVENKLLFHSENDISGSTTFKIVRSGRRNLLNTDAGNIVSLIKSPLENRTFQTYTGTYGENIDGCFDMGLIPDQFVDFLNDAIIINDGAVAGRFVSSKVIDYSYPYLVDYFGEGTMVDFGSCSDEGDQYWHIFFSNDDFLDGCSYNDYDEINDEHHIGYPDCYFDHSLQRVSRVPNTNDFVFTFLVDGVETDFSRTFVIKRKLTMSTSSNNLTVAKINNVLNSSAMTFMDSWSKDFSELISESQSFNPYQTGEKGIWAGQKSYTYAEKRKQTAGIDLENDGTIDNVPFFNWKVANYIDYVPQWLLSNEVTKLNSNSFETENRNILGIYSSALFGYDGMLSIAIAANSKQNEIGYENFEEYSSGLISQEDLISNNIDVYSNGSDVTRSYSSFDILTGQGNLLVVDMDYIPGYNAVKVDAVNAMDMTDKTNMLSGEYSVLGMGALSPGKTWVLISNGSGYPSSGLDIYWDGRVTFIKEHNNTGISNPVEVVKNNGHTGSSSLKVTGFTLCPQNRLVLVPGKKYIFSAWAKGDNTNVATYNMTNKFIEVSFGDGTVSGGQNSFVGKLINGWQKVEFEFIAQDENSILLNSSGSPFYLDDIRIFPKDGNIQTYVYDPENFRLIAVLDENNYATLYYYNEAGELFLVKKETIEGIKTIQESQVHIKELMP